MGSDFAYYVRTQDLTGLRARLPAFLDLKLDEGAEFVSIVNDAWEDTTDDKLAALSAALGTGVIKLGFSSVTDSFDYAHWEGGVLARALAYNCRTGDFVWERVAGSPEPWERWREPPRRSAEVSDREDQIVDPWWQVGAHFKLSGWGYGAIGRTVLGWQAKARKRQPPRKKRAN